MSLKSNIAIALKSLKLSSIALVIFNLNTIAFAQQQPKTQEVPTELQRLQYFEGSWSCRQPANSTKASGQFTWRVKQDLNNFWYTGKSEQVSTIALDSQPISSRDFLGYDTATKKLVRSVIVGNGNKYTMTATDWQNNQLVWDGTLVRQGKTMPFRQIVEKDSRYKFLVTYFLLDEEETWQPLVDEACIKTN